MSRRSKQTPPYLLEGTSAENLRYCKGCCRFKHLSCFMSLKRERYTMTCDVCRFRERERFWKEKERKKMMIMNRKKDCFSNESSVLDSQTLSVSETPVVPHSRWVLQPFAPHTHIASLVWYGYDEPTQKYPVSYVKGYTALL